MFFIQSTFILLDIFENFLLFEILYIYKIYLDPIKLPLPPNFL